MAGATLFSDQDANGNSSWFEVGGTGTDRIPLSLNGEYTVELSGLSAATVKLQQLSIDGTTAVDITDSSKTANGVFMIRLARGKRIRANAASVSGDAIYLNIAPNI